MKRFLLALLTASLLLYMPVLSFAGPKEEYEEAYKLYLSAGASAAAYSGRLGELANRYLEQEGWRIDHYQQTQGHSGARYLVARKDGIPYYLVAIVGTENQKDISIDLKVDKVYFSGSNTAEFAANAAKKDIPNSEPKVHRGFNEFVQSGLAAVLQNPRQVKLELSDVLQTDSSFRLLLTGHSLGGAAATLAGARLLNTGIRPEQLEVITFGAPAVGNAAFASKYAPILPLTRVVNSGDPVTGVLQKLVGGYRQFGREIKWQAPNTISDAHQLIGYIDSAIKNYYDKRRQAVKAGLTLPASPIAKPNTAGRVYLAPLQNNLPLDLTADFCYMQEALQDEYLHTIPDFVLATNQIGSSWRESALAAGCRWAVVSKVNATRIKQEESKYYITLTHTVYDVQTGNVATSATFSTATSSLTPLESFIHTFKGIHTHLDALFDAHKTLN